MAFVENILTPIIQLSVYLFMIAGLFFLIYKGIKTAKPDFYWALKYKVFKRDFREDDVEWCMDAIKNKWDAVQVKKFILIHGKSIKRANEIVYVFRQIGKKMKGGEESGELRSSDEQIEKIPKIKG